MVNEKGNNFNLSSLSEGFYDVRSEVLCSVGAEKDDPVAARLCYGTSTCIALISEKEGSVN